MPLETCLTTPCWSIKKVMRPLPHWAASSPPESTNNGKESPCGTRAPQYPLSGAGQPSAAGGGVRNPEGV